jgi:hypothetical protein
VASGYPDGIHTRSSSNYFQSARASNGSPPFATVGITIVVDVDQILASHRRSANLSRQSVEEAIYVSQ